MAQFFPGSASDNPALENKAGAGNATADRGFSVPQSLARIPRWIGQIIAATVLLILLLIAFAWAFGAFNGMSAQGDIALILGITFAMGLGIGLMTLVFYSSRIGRDETVNHPTRDGK
jgi:hypothetical protein